MRTRTAIRVIGILVAALLFGIAASVLKGNGAGVRDGLGNLSAPWVIVPLLAGAAGARGSARAGAAVGLGATVSALTGFYLANAFVLDLGPHSTLTDLGLTVNVGSIWFKAGAVSGPVMGALGAWASRRGWLIVAAIGAALVLLEPVAVYAYQHLRPGGTFAAGGGAWTRVYVGEGIAGLILVISLLLIGLRRVRRSPGL